MSLPEQTRPFRQPPGREALLGSLLGILAGLLGLAPWLISGARLPLQNLWGTEVLPEQMPVSLLPLSQYKLTTLVAFLTAGGAVAGLAVRMWSPARRRLVGGARRPAFLPSRPLPPSSHSRCSTGA